METRAPNGNPPATPATDYSSAADACIIRATRNPPDCDQKLTEIEQYVGSDRFKNKLYDTIFRVMFTVRASEGASPPVSFQFYVAGYVQFWNHDDPGCDEVSWPWWGRTAYLT
jgi:hypothetical protein